MVIFTFTTNEMISIFISQTYRSWVVIFHLRQTMAFLSLSLYDTPGLAPRMNVLFWEPGDFPVSFSNRGYIVERWKSSFRIKFRHKPLAWRLWLSLILIKLMLSIECFGTYGKFWNNTLWCSSVKLLYYILKCIHLVWPLLFGPFRYMLI